jgi:hypothetical protein
MTRREVKQVSEQNARRDSQAGVRSNGCNQGMKKVRLSNESTIKVSTLSMKVNSNELNQ